MTMLVPVILPGGIGLWLVSCEAYPESFMRFADD